MLAAASFFGNNLEGLDDPAALLAEMRERESSDRFLALGTNWHGLHFLLTGDATLVEQSTPSPSPLGNVVQGGTPTPFACTYGHVRSLTPDEIRAAAEALSQISVEKLRSRFTVASFNVAQIYPHGKRGRWTEEDAESLFEVYPQLVKFFQLAAKEGDMILLSSD